MQTLISNLPDSTFLLVIDLNDYMSDGKMTTAYTTVGYFRKRYNSWVVEMKEDEEDNEEYMQRSFDQWYQYDIAGDGDSRKVVTAVLNGQQVAVVGAE